MLPSPHTSARTTSRRLFATELVNSELPIHIGAALLGHLNLETTRGYVAVFEEDMIRHFQAHLARRRTLRPVEEYRPATDDEWAEFEEHFDKRKVELGQCGRPYGTDCTHEHSCIRCPMLRIEPKMLGRLDELKGDLLARRARAEAEGWLGEIEGIDLTLTFLVEKRNRAARQHGATPTDLGMRVVNDQSRVTRHPSQRSDHPEAAAGHPRVAVAGLTTRATRPTSGSPSPVRSAGLCIERCFRPDAPAGWPAGRVP